LSYFLASDRNIQVENPVAVLDQEEAKKFLTGKAEDKYNFFTKATELDRVDQTYKTSLDTLEEMANTQFRAKKSIDLELQRVKVLKKKYDEVKALGTLETELAQLHADFAWAYYRDVDEQRQVLVQVTV
jgi:structural maintenance of chromosomes protein 6